MKAESIRFPDTEEHWQELHQAASQRASDFLHSASATLRSKPVLAVGGAAIAGFVIGKLFLSGNRRTGMAKFFTASALPYASKALHQGYDFVKDHAESVREEVGHGGDVATKEVRRGLKKATKWLHSLTA